jgi:chromate transporter
MIEAPTPRRAPARPAQPSVAVVVREWGRIGCIGFGGPPAHIALLRELCVTRRRWLDDREFEDAIAATNLLPGPASTQLAIYCAWRLRGIAGALVGGVSFIVPGLILILALAALFLAASPPDWVLGAGAGSGAAVAAVALQAAAGLAPASWRRAAARSRWIAYLLVGGLAAATLGSWLVLVLLGCAPWKWPYGASEPPTKAWRAFTPGRCWRPPAQPRVGCLRWRGSPSRSAPWPTAAAS